MPVVSRLFESDADLRLMQSLQQALWALEAERTQTHVGDLAWWASMHAGREDEWKRRLWLDGGRCVAWAWLHRPASLDYEVHVDHRGDAVHEEVLDWFEAEAEGRSLQAWAMDGEDEVLQRRGFVQPAAPKSYVYYVQDLPPSQTSVPDGFVLRTVCGEEDLSARVAVHRAAFEPSRVTDESYRNVMRTWPYRSDLDCVVEAPDGTFAAYVLCWHDEANRVGEFEPVGTHPSYRRRGLGAAVCSYALTRLHEVGGLKAIVYAGGRDDDGPARALYESVGFRQHARATELRKER